MSSPSLIVSKFGGTSMAHASAMSQAAEIVCQNPCVRVVVVSATSGTTNQLLDLFRISQEDPVASTHLLDQIESRHLTIARELKSDPKTHQALTDALSELREKAQKLSIKNETNEAKIHTGESLDDFLSFGERLSSILFSQAIKNQGHSVEVFDVRQVLRTDSTFGKAEPDPAKIASLCTDQLMPCFQTVDVIVTQGFIGADAESRTTTLGRGGSDLSAALLAEGLNAQELHIWTDVNGIYTVDPNLFSGSKRIEHISFSEAAELANFGAKVLHPATLWPAMRKKVQVFVGSTFHPQGGGTWIHPELETRPLVRALALRKNQTLITVSSLRMLNAHGFLAKIFSILAQHQISIDLVTTSEVSVALTVDGTSLGSSGKSITENRELIEQLKQVAEVTIEENLSLIAIIGNNLTATSGVSAKAFSSINEFNVRLICHGASNHNLCFLVSSDVAKAILQRLHPIFIG